MDKVLRELIDYEKIKKLERSACRNPEEILGAHIEKVGMVISAYLPDAEEVSVEIGRNRYAMERIDAEGFFAVLEMDRKVKVPYKFFAQYKNGDVEEIEDPYSDRFGSLFTENDLRKFAAGTFYDSYKKMGAHVMSIDGVEGVHFAVWAPNAMRVSVVGDFNFWNGKRHQMKFLGDSGIFELFIPGLKAGMKYKFEVKTSAGELMLKSDPYGFQAELRPATASVVCKETEYLWHDETWLALRAKSGIRELPMSIYEVHLGSWMQKSVEKDCDGNEIPGSQFYNYRELAEKLSSYINEMGYTHVELMPLMEHPLDASWGYQVTGYYAPTSRYGTPDDLKAFVDHMHRAGIGVILDWVPAHFSKDAHGLAAFDGTCLYEHKDPRQGERPQWGTLIYNYGRPQVSNFLISNALYWVKEFHVDGIRMNAVESMLYLDYGKNTGEWIANLYGGNENLDAVEFLKHLNSIFHRETQGVIMIAEESSAWPRITGDLKEEGLGFDLKWNMGWTNDFLRYMQSDPADRHRHYGNLTFSMLYAYSEAFVQVFSHGEVVHGKGSMAAKMPGKSQKEKLADLRAAYGFFMGHPGKKHLFMGQDFGQPEEWNETKSLPWNLLDDADYAQMNAYVRALNRLYQTQPALYQWDFVPEGFEWVSCMYETENILAFIRKSGKREETLLFVCNFLPNAHEKFQIGVPFAGTYRELLNSDDTQFGGEGMTNPEIITSEQEEKDGRTHSICIALAPMGVCVFRCTPNEGSEKNGKQPDESDVSELENKKGAGRKLSDTLDMISGRVGKLIKKK